MRAINHRYSASSCKGAFYPDPPRPTTTALQCDSVKVVYGQLPSSIQQLIYDNDTAVVSYNLQLLEDRWQFKLAAGS